MGRINLKFERSPRKLNFLVVFWLPSAYYSSTYSFFLRDDVEAAATTRLCSTASGTALRCGGIFVPFAPSVAKRPGEPRRGEEFLAVRWRGWSAASTAGL